MSTIFKKIKEIITRDDNPRWTRFVTYYIMPPAIVLFFWGAFDTVKQIDKVTSSNNSRYGIVTSIRRYDYSSRKKKEYSLLFQLNRRSHVYNISSVHFRSNKLAGKLNIGDRCSLKFVSYRGIKRVCSLSVNGQQLLTKEQYISNLLKIKYVTFFFTILFLVWFCSRVYRYRRYGRLTKNIA